jgi:hypothetical protein
MAHFRSPTCLALASVVPMLLATLAQWIEGVIRRSRPAVGIILARYGLRPISPADLLRFARKRNLASGLRQNNPPGKSPESLSSPFAKNIPLHMSCKSPA